MAKILLIDDDALVREALKGFLEMGGHEVTLAAHGVQALAAVSRIEFQLVLTDILMPEMEGIEIVRRFRELCPSMPIVAMSGGMVTQVRKGVRVSVDYLDMALRLGAMKIIRKPFTPRQLLEVVNGCLLSRAHQHEYEARGSRRLRAPEGFSSGIRPGWEASHHS
jgi:CheY-like chemotaxis protein